ncbi:MAG: ribbon-helix-helix domain-containing protein, partial [Asgard group archaeon]|nr:ribbon-helix-helix domain-containing protein [Asgard group archaeon]
PAEYLSDLDELVRQQRYPNRSETIRVAIRDLLREELWRSKSASTTVVQHSS